MTTVTQMKCACDSCLCVVTLSEAVAKNDQYYCCDACANGHLTGAGCGHKGCNCDK